jgi:PKD repeat protein
MPSLTGGDRPRSAVRSRPDRDRARGQSLVELALLLPVLLFIVLVGIDFGRGFAGWVTIQQSARVGANYLSINASQYGTNSWNQTLATMRQLVRRDAVTANCEITAITPTIPDPPKTGDPAKVTVDCDFTIATPIISAILPNPLPMSASAVFPVRTAVTGAGYSGPAIPLAAMSCAPTSGTAPLNISCTDQTPAVYDVSAWHWDFGDGTTSTERNPQHTYSSACPGPSYVCTVIFTATNITGTSGPVTQPITVEPAAGSLVASFTCNPCSGSANLFVQFTDTSIGSPTSWAWDLDGDNIVDSTLQNPNHTYTAPGTTIVTLTVTDAAAATSSVSYNITVDAGCVVPSFVGDAVSKPNVTKIQAKWNGANFNTTVLFNPLVTKTSKGTVVSQSLGVGSTQPCDSTITLTWH